jgi:hypothetical protein
LASGAAEQFILGLAQQNKSGSITPIKGVKAAPPMNLAKQVLDIPMTPDHPDWAMRVPKPANIDPPPVEAQPVAPSPTVGGKKRLVISYGPRAGEYVMAVEEAPEWDFVDAPKVVSKGAIVEMMPILAQLGVKIRNLTPERFKDVGQSISQSNDGGTPCSPIGGEGGGKCSPSRKKIRIACESGGDVASSGS